MVLVLVVLLHKLTLIPFRYRKLRRSGQRGEWETCPDSVPVSTELDVLPFCELALLLQNHASLISWKQVLNQNVAAGFVTTNPSVKVTFPTDSSTASQLARLNAAAVTLQNLEGPGKGCPIASTTFTAQGKAIEAGGSSPGPAPTTTPSPMPPSNSTIVNSATGVPTPATNVTSSDLSSSSNTSPTDAEIAALAPPLGWQSGINPDGKHPQKLTCCEP